MANKKILLVDDEVSLVAMIKKRLEANNYDVITAYDGLEAMDKVKKEKPDLIVLDLMLPRMDGYRVCGLLKKDSQYLSIPIIMFTARAQEIDIKMGKEMGCDAYIIKPFDSKTLLDKIEELLK